MEGGLRELLSDIQKDRTRLRSLEDTLSQRPNDTTLNKLRDDLLEVLTLKLNLYKVKQAKLQQDQQQQQQQLPAASTSSSSSSVPLPSDTPDVQWPPSVGQRVMALWEDNQYYIAEITKETPGGRFGVSYLEYGNSWNVSLQQIYPFNTYPSKSDILAGKPCRALSKSDGIIHDAIVLRAPVGDSTSCLLFFQHLNAQEEVSVNDIFSVTGPASGSSMSGNKRKFDDVAALANVLDKPTLPENLRIQPTDSEAERLAKKKKIKNIKNQHKEVKQEIERSVKQSEWQSFKNTVAGKKKPGFLSGVVMKESIFKSPDSIDGKVGVTGSGKPMTTYQTLGRIDKKIAMQVNQAEKDTA